MRLLSLLAALWTMAPAAFAGAPRPLGLEDAVGIAVSSDPQVLAAKAQYASALHQIDQAYTPEDPQLSISDQQTPNSFTDYQQRSVGVSLSLQFPGKGWLQGDEAHRDAEIARLAYEAAVRDARAQVETAYYQTLLDSASVQIAQENAASLAQVLGVARVAYIANQVTEADLISAQFALTQSTLTVWADQAAESNDEASLDTLLARDPQEPLVLAGTMSLAPLPLPLDAVKARALGLRQEILEAALSEKNAKTARTLAWMELLPDYSVSWSRNTYPAGSIDSAYPAGSYHDDTASLTFNVPVFFWFRQKEDIRSADALLDAARRNREGVRLQTAAAVVTLYRNAELAYKTALINQSELVPLAEKDFRVALVAYQAKQIDFTTLAAALQSVYSARISYLTAANQFLASRVALEQAMGGPFPR